ncbi:T9SS type A sorting domain-containing protein [Draconibacterium halophilum]|uniref:T9SS type A sorting domain-containing protein n=1 Tax=Draconibacterium halophilum TaxID=2706887 RepID=A0A6C0RI97_9BACT|nr:T9SS type A sorting domain-containing protein [Draconibacterium halophilum]QIA09562.1 T9SS type A sorting domain-containing protein [Draconibacterium halophilum]
MKYIILLFLTLFIASQSFAQDPGFTTFQNEKDTTKDVKVYPNPCKNNKVTIDYSSKDISEIRLTNITGKQVYLKEYDFPTPKIQLQLNEIPNGIYLIQITTTDNKRTVKKLMISRN